jgi:hypothetical protein
MTSLTGLSMAIPSAIGGLKSLNTALGLTALAE